MPIERKDTPQTINETRMNAKQLQLPFSRPPLLLVGDALMFFLFRLSLAFRFTLPLRVGDWLAFPFRDGDWCLSEAILL